MRCVSARQPNWKQENGIGSGQGQLWSKLEQKTVAGIVAEAGAGTATATAASTTGNGSAQPGGATRRTSGKMERQTRWTHGRTTYTVSALLVASPGYTSNTFITSARVTDGKCAYSSFVARSPRTQPCASLPASQSVVCLGLMSCARAKGQMKIFQLLQTPPALGRNVNLTL